MTENEMSVSAETDVSSEQQTQQTSSGTQSQNANVTVITNDPEAKTKKDEKEEGEIEDDEYDMANEDDNDQETSLNKEQSKEEAPKKDDAGSDEKCEKHNPRSEFTAEITKTLTECSLSIQQATEQQQQLQPQQQPNASSDMEYDDDEDDDDDDEYCLNNKRLKIDESETESPKTAQVVESQLNMSDDKPESTKTPPSEESNVSGQSTKKPAIENDFEFSSSSSSSSTSSTATEISAISSTSLPLCSFSSSSSTGSASSTKAEMATTGDSVSVINETQPVETLSADEASKTAKDAVEKLKVPPLKIICSHSNGGLPYVKTAEEKAATSGNKRSKASPDAVTTELQQAGAETSSTTTTRSKAAKNSNRVASPPAAATTPGTKSTPTRRAAQNLSNRNSPSTKTFASTNVNSSPKPAPVPVTPTPAQPSVCSSQSGGVGSSNGTGTSSDQNEADNVIRRKLRSHTRQLAVGDVPLLTLGSNKSPSSSPLTVLTDSVGPDTAEQLSQDSHKANEESNDSSATAAPVTIVVNPDTTGSARKRRLRQQAQTPNDNGNSIITTQSQTSSSSSSSLSENEKTNNPNNGSNSGQTSPVLNPQTSESQSGEQNDPNQQQSSGSDNKLLANDPTASGSLVDSNSQYTTNCIKKFVDIRSEVAKKRDALMQTQVEIKLPRNINEFLIVRKNYLIKSNKDVKQSIPFFKPPNDLPDDLKEFFLNQEKERYKLRLRHRVEQDKLLLLYEQEVLRCFSKLSRDELNQNTIPFSFCAIIKDDEVYSLIKNEQSELSNCSPYVTTNFTSFVTPNGNINTSQVINNNNNNNNNTTTTNNNNQDNTQSNELFTVPKSSNPLSNEEKLINNLNEIKLKFVKFRDDTIKRQLHESDSLQAIQKMDFQSTIRELALKHKLASAPLPASNNPSSSSSSAGSSTPTGVSTACSLNAYTQIAQFQPTDYHVPIVHVNNKLDLFDSIALSLNTITSTLSSANVSSSSSCPNSSSAEQPIPMFSI